MAASQDTSLEASNIANKLWVGSMPPFDRDLPEIDTLVLCAHELQPEQLAFTRQLIRVRLPDSALTTEQLRQALLAGRAVAQALTAGRRVLVTCLAGLNRSALVAGLGLGLVTRMTPDEIIARIRKGRGEHALSNPHFRDYLTRFVVTRAPADPSARRR